MATIKILGGTVPKQSASYLWGILTIKDNDKSSQTYVTRAAIKAIEKVSEDKKSITFKLSLTDENHFIGNVSRKIFDKLITDEATPPQAGDGDGIIKQKPKEDGKSKPFEPAAKKKKSIIDWEKEATTMLRFWSWFGVYLLFSCAVGAVANQAYVSGALFLIAMILITPPTNKYLSDTIKEQKSKIVLILLVLGVVAEFIIDAPNIETSVSQEIEQVIKVPVINFEIVSSKDSNQVGGKAIDERLFLKTKSNEAQLKTFMLDRYQQHKNNGYAKIFIYAYPSKNVKKAPLSWASRLEWIKVNGSDAKVYFNQEQLVKIKEVIEEPSVENTAPPAPKKVKKTEVQKAVEFLNGAGWKVNIDKSAIDDSQTVTLGRQSYSSFTSEYGEKITPSLVIRCQENKTNLFISWDVYLGIDSIRVTTRLDDKPAQTKNWSISTDNKASFTSSPIALIKSMLDRTKMVVRVTPYGANTKTVEFGVNGLRSEIEPLRKACGW